MRIVLFILIVQPVKQEFDGNFLLMPKCHKTGIESNNYACNDNCPAKTWQCDNSMASLVYPTLLHLNACILINLSRLWTLK
jgi:hypothetical protein